MSGRTTAKVLRRRSLAVVDQLSYVPVSRLTFTIMLNVLLSQQWLLAGLRPAADYMIARTAPVVPGVRVKRVSAPVRGEWVRAPEADDAAGVVLVLHGSGYLICSARTHRGFASHLSENSGMPHTTRRRNHHQHRVDWGRRRPSGRCDMLHHQVRSRGPDLRAARGTSPAQHPRLRNRSGRRAYRVVRRPPALCSGGERRFGRARRHRCGCGRDRPEPPGNVLCAAQASIGVPDGAIHPGTSAPIPDQSHPGRPGVPRNGSSHPGCLSRPRYRRR